MTTLENSYCVPRMVEECTELLLSNGLYWFGGWVVGSSVIYSPSAIYRHRRELDGRTEIPAKHFLDLIRDKIVLWRLEEHGFNNPFGDTYTLRLEHDWDGIIVTRVVRVIGGKVSVNGYDVNVTTFTDLLTLIRMLTPPSND